MSEQKALTDIEQEALLSWREWPIYVVLRLKHLQEIQQKLRIQGETQSQLLRRDEMLKAAHDRTGEESPFASDQTPAQQTNAAASSNTEAETEEVASGDDEDYFETLNYEEE